MLATEKQTDLYQRQKSLELWQEMKERIPGGVNSPVRACRAVGVHPVLVESSKGSKVLDIDGNEFIDFCMSWGAVLHGHAHPRILEAAYNAMVKGTTFGITSPYEGSLAKIICSTVPSVEMVRFVSSGTEATMSAVRLARAFTGKSNVLKFHGHYHGHADQFLIHAGSGLNELPKASSDGVPDAFIQHTKTLPFNDVDALYDFLFTRNEGKDLACVIVEPIAANMGVVPLSKKCLQLLEEGRKKFGFLIVFDEVVTGFRVAQGGAQKLYQCVPDLTCFGKIIGGGFPAAAFGGRKEIMMLLAPLGKVYQAGTLSGNPVAMAAGCATLSIALDSPNFYPNLKRKSLLFTKPIVKYIRENNLNASLQSVGTMWTLFFGVRRVATSYDIQKLRHDMFREYFQYMLNAGIYIPPLHNEAWCLSYAHTEDDLKKAKDATVEFFIKNRSELQSMT